MLKADRVILTLVAIVLPMHSVVLAQGTFFLKPYELQASLFEGLMEHQARWLSKCDKPEELKGIPKDAGKRQYYYRGQVAGREVFALVASGKTRLLYVDLDGDQDLADEKPVSSKRVRSTFNFGWSMAYRFGPLSFDRPATQPASAGNESAGADSARDDAKADADEPASTPFFVEQLDLDYLVVRPAACRRGTVRIGEKTYAAFLTDGNYNGRYDDAFKHNLKRSQVRRESVDADLIALDLNRDGRIGTDEFEVPEIQPLTRLLQLRGTYYSVEVTPDGRSITLDAAKPEMGKIDLDKQDAELMVCSDNGASHVVVREGVGILPVGKYRLWYVILRATDDKKTVWTLRGQASEKKPYEFEVQAGKTTPLKIGPPLTMQTVQRSHRTLLSGKVVSFGVSCVDGAGVEYAAGSDRGRIRGPAPAVKIFDEAGKTVSVGKFEYG